MRMVYLPANKAYGVTLGANSTVLVDIDGQYLYNSKRELSRTLARHGLKLSGNKIVLKEEETHANGSQSR